MAKRNAPRINFNLVAAAIIGIVIAAGVIGVEWQPASDMAGLLQQLQQELVGERWEEAAARCRRCTHSGKSGESGWS